jgi:hypothetical protein
VLDAEGAEVSNARAQAEALENEIASAKLALDICEKWPTQVGAALKTQRVLIAALELAKADAELEAFYEKYPRPDSPGVCDEDASNKKLHHKLWDARVNARTKLYEAITNV